MVKPMGFEFTDYMITKEFCGAPRPSKVPGFGVRNCGCKRASGGRSICAQDAKMEILVKEQMGVRSKTPCFCPE
jgi:hypothetical protein